MDPRLVNQYSCIRAYAHNSRSEMLRTHEFSVRNILRTMNVKLVCTTEGPLDSLEHHNMIREEGFEIKVYAAFRPDKAMAAENVSALNEWIDRLEEVSGLPISRYAAYIEALRKRHDYFHGNGCRLSDYGLETAYADKYTEKEIRRIFAKIRSGKDLDESEQGKFKS